MQTLIAAVALAYVRSEMVVHGCAPLSLVKIDFNELIMIDEILGLGSLPSTVDAA